MSDGRSILVIGASGMLGHVVLRYLAQAGTHRVHGTVRSVAARELLPGALHGHVSVGVDALDDGHLRKVFEAQRPGVVINCVGVVKQLREASDPVPSIAINSLLPHRLARLCAQYDARLVHVSTDCVFSGSKGMYLESDFADADDLYGRSKYLGEVDYPHALTLRTSIIGPELGAPHGLVGWFLSQRGQVRGFAKAIFSGLPTVELARVIRDHVLPWPGAHGTYHVSAAPIDKFELLQLVARQYGVDTKIARDDALVIDRSLDSGRFRHATGYTPPAWPELIRAMHAFG